MIPHVTIWNMIKEINSFCKLYHEITWSNLNKRNRLIDCHVISYCPFILNVYHQHGINRYCNNTLHVLHICQLTIAKSVPEKTRGKTWHCKMTVNAAHHQRRVSVWWYNITWVDEGVNFAHSWWQMKQKSVKASRGRCIASCLFDGSVSKGQLDHLVAPPSPLLLTVPQGGN